MARNRNYYRGNRSNRPEGQAEETGEQVTAVGAQQPKNVQQGLQAQRLQQNRGQGQQIIYDQNGQRQEVKPTNSAQPQPQQQAQPQQQRQPQQQQNQPQYSKDASSYRGDHRNVRNDHQINRNRQKAVETFDDIKADNARIEKEIGLEIKEIKNLNLGL